jgi:hypothetical protein
MKYTVEIGQNAMIYIQSFIKTGSVFQKLIAGIQRHTDKMPTAKVYFHFFQNKRSRLNVLSKTAGLEIIKFLRRSRITRN